MIGWTFDQTFFRSLVGFYVLSMLAVFAAVAYEIMGPGWSEFSTQSDLLIEDHFGSYEETADYVSLAISGGGLAWHFASILGLRKFLPWARWGFWASLLVITLSLFVPGAIVPTYAGPLGTLMGGVSYALTGAILLLAYSREHGGEWFRPKLEKLKETF